MARAATPPPLLGPPRGGSSGRAVFDLRTEQLQSFTEGFLSSFQMSWSFALTMPTWRDILKRLYSSDDSASLQTTLDSIVAFCDEPTANSSTTIIIPKIRGVDDIEVSPLLRPFFLTSLCSTPIKSQYT